MSKLRYLIVGAAGAALFVGGAIATAAAPAPGNSDTHGDTVSLAARTGCPHGPNGVHGECVSAIASSNSESDKKTSTCTTGDTAEDTTETGSAQAEDTTEQAAKTGKAADRSEDKSERSTDRTEDKTEKQQVKACEAAQEASNQ